jgi:hypothetical protein
MSTEFETHIRKSDKPNANPNQIQREGASNLISDAYGFSRESKNLVRDSGERSKRSLGSPLAEFPSASELLAQPKARNEHIATSFDGDDKLKPRSEGADGNDKTKTVKLGGAEVSFKDGKVEKITLPLGIAIEYDGKDGKYRSSEKSPIDKVSFDKEKNEITIEWAKKNGVKETSYVRPTGFESVYDPPSKVLDIDNIRSVEFNSKNEMRVRTKDGKIYIADITSKPGESLNAKAKEVVDPPEKIKEKDLSKLAREVAYLVSKNAGQGFGHEHDKDYIEQAYRRARKTGALKFEEEINKLLEKEAGGPEKNGFRIDVMSVRPKLGEKEPIPDNIRLFEYDPNRRPILKKLDVIVVPKDD